jgi:hypothetical protein
MRLLMLGCCGAWMIGLAAPASAACLSYADRVELTGNFETKIFPGPPNFESVADGDAPERVMLLHLAAPVCVTAGTGDSDAAVAAIAEIQLVPNDALSRSFRNGKRVTLSGKLMGPETGHHHTAVLLDDVDVE